MSQKAAENGSNGWVWRRLRDKDRIRQSSNFLGINDEGEYDKPIPLHALKKIDEIERNFKNEVRPSFFVSDYKAPNPDPFLMTVIQNDKVDKGIGCYVIDVWDEPGFGLEQQLKV